LTIKPVCVMLKPVSAGKISLSCGRASPGIP
jgi:hypothetical protein